jgi:hypothetical protein
MCELNSTSVNNNNNNNKQYNCRIAHLCNRNTGCDTAPSNSFSIKVILKELYLHSSVRCHGMVLN